MFNLLPKAKKELIRREYHTRLAVVSLWLLLAALVMSSLLLLPSFFLSSVKEQTAREQFVALSESTDQDKAAELDAVLADTTARVTLLTGQTPKVFLHELLTLIASIKSDSVSFTTASFGAPAEGKRDLLIAGIAKDRAALLAFVQALEKTGVFETVEAPISNFAKDADITFEVRARGAI